MLKVRNIDTHKYNSDMLYKMIKVGRISYEMLTKEVLLDVIVKAESNGNGSGSFKGKKGMSINGSYGKRKSGDDEEIRHSQDFKDFGSKRRRSNS